MIIFIFLSEIVKEVLGDDMDFEEVPEKTTKIWYFKSNDALNNLLDDSKGGFAQVIFNAACCFHIWRSPAATQEDNNLPHNEYIKDIFWTLVKSLTEGEFSFLFLLAQTHIK